jgi:predicted metalloprotease
MFLMQRTLIAVAFLGASFAAWTASPSSTDSVRQQSAGFFRDANRFWAREFVALGGRYRKPELTWYSQQISDVCNLQGVLAGPFYCPISQRIYLDQAFLEQLAEHSGTTEPAVLGYVIAHEVAHHVQGIVGTTGLVEEARYNSTPELANRTLIRMELQADCYTGLWLRSAAKDGLIKPLSDLSVMLDGMWAFGREWQNKLPAGQIMPDPLDQGSAAQRLKWVRRGLDSGNFNDCDTFGVESTGDK